MERLEKPDEESERGREEAERGREELDDEGGEPRRLSGGEPVTGDPGWETANVDGVDDYGGQEDSVGVGDVEMPLLQGGQYSSKIAEGGIDAEALFLNCLQTIRLPRMKVDGTLEDLKDKPVALNSSSLNEAAPWTVGGYRRHMTFFEFDHFNWRSDAVSFMKRFCITLIIVTLYIIVGYAIVFDAPWGAGSGVGRGLLAMADQASQAAELGLQSSSSSIADIAADSTSSDSAKRSEFDTVPGGIPGTGFFGSEGSDWTEQVVPDRRLEGDSSAASSFMRESGHGGYIGSSQYGGWGSPSSSPSSSPPSSGLSVPAGSSPIEDAHDSPDTASTHPIKSLRPQKGEGRHPWVGGSSQEGVSAASGSVVMSVDSPATFSTDPYVTEALAQTLGDSAGVPPANVVVKIYPLRARQVVAHFSIMFPSSDEESEKVMDAYSGRSSLALVTSLNYNLQELGSEQTVHFLVASSLREQWQADDLWGLGGRLSRWAIWFGAAIGAFLAYWHSFHIAEYVHPLVNYICEDEVDTAMQGLKDRLSKDVVKLMEEATSVKRSGNMCFAPRRQLPEGFTRAASDVVSEMLEGVIAVEKLVDKQALRPQWASDKNHLILRIAIPMWILVGVQFICGLAGIGPLVSFYSIFAPISASSESGTIGHSSVHERGGSSLPLPRGAYECARVDEICDCAGAVFHGDRLVSYKIDGEVDQFLCENTSALIRPGTSCFCDPFTRLTTPMTKGEQVVGLVFRVDEFSDIMACEGTQELRDIIEKEVKEAIAHVAGLWTAPGHIRVSFPALSRILAIVTPPKHATAALLEQNLKKSADSFQKAMADHLGRVPGLQATGGRRHVTLKVIEIAVRDSPGRDSREWQQPWDCLDQARRLDARSEGVPKQEEQAAAARQLAKQDQELGPSGGICPEGAFQSVPFKLGCEAGSGDFSRTLEASVTETVFTIYEGSEGVQFLVVAPAGSEQLVVTLRDVTYKRVVLGNGLPIPSMLKYAGATIECPMRGQTLQCLVKGTLRSRIDVEVRNDGAHDAPITARYSYSKVSPCPNPPPGCTALNAVVLQDAARSVDDWKMRINPDDPDNGHVAYQLVCQKLVSGGATPSSPGGGASPSSTAAPQLPSWQEVAEQERQSRLLLSGQVCDDGLSWKQWQKVFASDSTRSRVAFYMMDLDRNGVISKAEFSKAYERSGTWAAVAQAEAEQERLEGSKRPSWIDLEGGDWPDESWLSGEVQTQMVQLWTNVIIIMGLGLVGGWPLMRYLANQTLEEIEGLLRSQLLQSCDIILSAGYIARMQAKVDKLHDHKEDLKQAIAQEGNCCLM